MFEAMLVPGGRIGPAAFRNAYLVLIAIGVGIQLVPLVWPSLLIGFLGLVMLYPSAVLWVKRFHDAGKSGWWFLAVFAATIAAGLAANHFIIERFAPAIIPGSSAAEVFAQAAARMQAVAIPSAIVSTVISLAFVFIINEELKSDPNENQYGPPPPR